MSAEPAILTTSVQEYFKDLLGEAKQSQGVRVADVTEYYLVNLLSDFLDAERLYVRDEEGVVQEEPLALILKRALEGDRNEQIRELRRLGDTSLYVAGFFGDHIDQKIVDSDYYMSMGHHAYSSLARLLGGARGADTFSGLYDELATKFTSIVDVLNEVSERVSLTSQQGVVRLYERFLRTGSGRMARLLAEQGVAPVFGARPKVVQ